MNKKLFATLNTILKKDSKDATYKFALLRALVEISEEAEHHIVRTDKDMVVLPLGLIINKWLYYYYSLIEQDMPQRNGEEPGHLEGKKLSFRCSECNREGIAFGTENSITSYYNIKQTQK